MRGKSHFCRNAQILRKVPGKLTNKHKNRKPAGKAHGKPFIKLAGKETQAWKADFRGMWLATLYKQPGVC